LDYSSKASVLMEASSGKVLFSQNENERLPIASVTKIMSILLVVEAIDSGKISLSDNVTVSEYASSMGGSQVFLEAGENKTFRCLIACRHANTGMDVEAEYVEIRTDREGLRFASARPTRCHHESCSQNRDTAPHCNLLMSGPVASFIPMSFAGPDATSPEHALGGLRLSLSRQGRLWLFSVRS
jgi:hypothetical protein